MTLKVIGAGFGRTGTLSLKLALEELGLGPCYHMIEVNAHPEHDAMWLAFARGEASDWRPMLTGYASTVDWPTTAIWKELAVANPQAKIILTLRDPERWYESAAATIFARMLEFETLRAETLRAEALRSDPAAVDPVRRRHMEMIDTLIVEKTFGGSLAKDRAIAVFNAHNDEVRRVVPAERLLVYESGEGWAPLCAFLGVPVPATPYPKVNTTGDFASRFPGER
ncbi:sulfotransferase family protein [Methyloceanibacter sp.]|uniref:sulfotransferase family protein n=1 Tax=Methyloceanibacter sp. TaxID=1965321 RepID=UPI003D6D9891